MSVALLDVNALIGLLLDEHPFHASISQWFGSRQNLGWATCPITQQGFVRIVSNVANFQPAPKVREALDLLENATTMSKLHEFWPGDIALSSLEPNVRRRIQGHRQITDAYLLSLAIQHRGRLITFDRRMLALAPDESDQRQFLEIMH